MYQRNAFCGGVLKVDQGTQLCRLWRVFEAAMSDAQQSLNCVACDMPSWEITVHAHAPSPSSTASLTAQLDKHVKHCHEMDMAITLRAKVSLLSHA